MVFLNTIVAILALPLVHAAPRRPHMQMETTVEQYQPPVLTAMAPEIVYPPALTTVGPATVGPLLVGPKINCGFKDLFPCNDGKECAMIGGKAVQITNDCLKVKEAQVEVAKSAIVGPGIVGPKIVGPKINCGFRNLLPCGDNKECVMINGKSIEITNDCASVKKAQSEASANVAAPARPAPANAAANVLLASKNQPSSICNFQQVFDCGQAFQNGKRIGRKSCTKIDGKDVVVETACELLKMKQQASSDGINIRINSGFRTNAKQAELFSCFQTKACNNGNLAARPGFSNHQNGIALDINVVDNAVFRWLSDNAAKFGFVRTVASEPHHWELRPGSRCNAFVQFSCKSA